MHPEGKNHARATLSPQPSSRNRQTLFQHSSLADTTLGFRSLGPPPTAPPPFLECEYVGVLACLLLARWSMCKTTLGAGEDAKFMLVFPSSRMRVPAVPASRGDKYTQTLMAWLAKSGVRRLICQPGAARIGTHPSYFMFTRDGSEHRPPNTSCSKHPPGGWSIASRLHDRSGSGGRAGQGCAVPGPPPAGCLCVGPGAVNLPAWKPSRNRGVEDTSTGQGRDPAGRFRTGGL